MIFMHFLLYGETHLYISLFKIKQITIKLLVYGKL